MRKDIQTELYELTKDMTKHNIYKNLCYFLIENCTEDDTYSDAYRLAQIIGLLSDSYFGKIACGFLNEDKKN